VPDIGSRSFNPSFNTIFQSQASEARDSGPANASDLDGSRSDIGHTGGRGTSALGSYRVETVIDKAHVEYRMYKDGFHFNSLIWTGGTLPYRGCYQVQVCPTDYAKWALINRPHVEADVNGWGSSVYWNPYVRGSGSDSTTDAENGWVRDIDNTVNGVFVRAEGRVARGNQGGTFGTFETVRRIAYDAAAKAMQGAGTLQIILNGSLAAAGLDLNVERIASNQMPDVPLWTGDRGTTGDIEHVKYAYANGTPLTWLPVNTPMTPMGTIPTTLARRYPSNWPEQRISSTRRRWASHASSPRENPPLNPRSPTGEERPICRLAATTFPIRTPSKLCDYGRNSSWTMWRLWRW
jgi:hypothetical protein